MSTPAPGFIGRSSLSKYNLGKTFRFEVPGDPVAKARPRATRDKYWNMKIYTPKKSKAFEEKVALCARLAGVTPLKGPLALKVMFCFEVQPFKKRKRTKFVGAWRETKPDLDNLLKAVKDGMNAIAYADDRQVVLAEVQKVIAPEPYLPKTVVWVGELIGAPEYYPYNDV